MSFDLRYLLMPKEQKREALIATALKDSFFVGIVHDLIDYGYEASFSPFGGAGAYQPHALETEPLDNLDKQMLFAQAFSKKVESGAFKAKIKLSVWLGQGGNAHSFLHELMHFYEDMLGLLLMPLKEQGVLPVMADLRTSVISLLFCEAWAEVEALRTCRSLKTKGLDTAPWIGALSSPDWGALARFYEDRLVENRGEAHAAARTFEQWYKGKQRGNYEYHALENYEKDFVRFTQDLDVAEKTDDAIKDHLRSARISGLLKKIPQHAVPKYFDLIDWENAAFNELHNDVVLGRCDAFETRYGPGKNDALHEIKVASPPYLWKRLRDAEIEASEVPPAPPDEPGSLE